MENISHWSIVPLTRRRWGGKLRTHDLWKAYTLHHQLLPGIHHTTDNGISSIPQQEGGKKGKKWTKEMKTYRRNQNLITRLDTHLNSFSFRIYPSRTNSQYLRLRELLDRWFWQIDTGGGLCFGLDSLDEYTVQEGCEWPYAAEWSSLDSTMIFSSGCGSWGKNFTWIDACVEELKGLDLIGA